MLKSDKKGKSVILYKGSEVKKNEKLVTAKFDFSSLALKILAALIASIKDEDTADTIYQFDIKHFMNISKTEDKRMYKEVKEAVVEIMEKVIQIEDENRWSGFHILRKPVIEKNLGIITLKFDEDIFPLLKETKSRYLMYDIENILSLSSKYAIRLYEILKDIYKKKTFKRNISKVEEIIEVDYLREILIVPKNYKYADFKRRVLEIAKKQINENTDILFEYDEVKTGRRVTHLRFIICVNPAKISKLQNSYFNSRKNFVSLLRKNYSGNRKFWGWKTIDKTHYWLGLDKDGLVYGTAGDEIIDFNSIESAKIYDIWLKIAQNSDIYRQLIEQGASLKEIAENNKELWLNLKEDIIRLKEEGII